MDWINAFLDYTEGTPTPDIYRLWAGITAISGALERRTWIITSMTVLYPNLYTVLMGPPATGKSIAINPVRNLWKQTKKVRIAPDDMTKASMIDAIADAKRIIITPEGPIEYHSLAIANSEFGVLISQHDLAFLSILTHIYDGPAHHIETRRGNPKENPDLVAPLMTLLSGATPSFLASVMPEEAWGQGFTSRLILVYAGATPYVDLFEARQNRDDLLAQLTSRLAALASDDFRGEFTWDDDARDAMRAWHKEKLAPVPEHSRLQGYNGRRIMHMLKLCMISSASRGTSLRITHVDFIRAKQWLLDVEARMPDTFKDMGQKSDYQVVQELHYHLWQKWGQVPAVQRQPFAEATVWDFLRIRAPSDKIPRILEVAERSGVLTRNAGTQTYTPRPLHEHGMA